LSGNITSDQYAATSSTLIFLKDVTKPVIGFTNISSSLGKYFDRKSNFIASLLIERNSWMRSVCTEILYYILEENEQKAVYHFNL
jgi:hypothetical protein